MQFNKYTKHLYPRHTWDPKWVSKYLLGFNRFVDKWNSNKLLPLGAITSLEFLLPFNKNLAEGKHYNILYIIAKHMGVKLMWRDILDRNGYQFRKGLWIIGQHPRIAIAEVTLNYYFRIHYEYHTWLVANAKGQAKKAGYKSVRSYASQRVDAFEDSTYITLKNKLVEDREYEVHLEYMIKELFKLDYKKFPTDKPEYYHAIGSQYHHKRMLL